MEKSWSHQWTEARDQLRRSPLFFRAFLKNPIDQITLIPDWNWVTLALLEGLMAAVSGVAVGILTGSALNTLFGLLIFPITATLGVGITALFLHYTILVFQRQEVSLRKLSAIVVLASLFFHLVRILSPFVPALDLVGLAAGAGVMIVGISDNFGLHRRFVVKVVASLYALILISWVGQRIAGHFQSRQTKAHVTPESWEILEREINSIDTP